MNRLQLSQVFQFLGVEPVLSPSIDYYLNPATSKINFRLTYYLIPNAEEIEDKLGSNT